jgi:hypothetical protein
MFPNSTHVTFAQKLYQTFKNHKLFIKPKLLHSDFTICHYAGHVSVHVCIVLCSNVLVIELRPKKQEIIIKREMQHILASAHSLMW